MQVKIPISSSEQTKIEYIMRQTPSAYVREEQEGDRVRKFYSFPKDQSLFAINCTADHYFGSKFPSSRKCSIICNVEKPADEFKYTLKDTDLPVGQNYSLDQTWGTNADGKYQHLFQYAFDCNKERTCTIRFATEPGDH